MLSNVVVVTFKFIGKSPTLVHKLIVSIHASVDVATLRIIVVSLWGFRNLCCF